MLGENGHYTIDKMIRSCDTTSFNMYEALDDEEDGDDDYGSDHMSGGGTDIENFRIQCGTNYH